MADSSDLHVQQWPVLRDPVLIVAFAGWNDAGQAATQAVKHLQRTWRAQEFASIDPETFYDFTETRPLVEMTVGGERSIRWPRNRFFAAQLPSQERDAVLLIGNEPQLRWRTFCSHIMEVAGRVHASTLVAVGALLADVPHTMPPVITGSAWGPQSAGALQRVQARVSSYEGPTGIVGVLTDAWKITGRPGYSLWGSAPHYISASPNPQVALALVRSVATLLQMRVPVDLLATEAEAFTHRVDEALADNEEARDYVRLLEEQHAHGEPPPAGPELLSELEEFLRSRRPDNGKEDGSS